MDDIDRRICGIIQSDGRISSTDVAEAVGVSVSTANERVRRLVESGVVREWRGVLDPARVGAGLCAFILIDMAYEGEAEAAAALEDRPEVLELHHISGAHSYLAKIRVANTGAMQSFLQDTVKPLKAVVSTESLISLSTLKETTAVLISNSKKNE